VSGRLVRLYGLGSLLLLVAWVTRNFVMFYLSGLVTFIALPLALISTALVIRDRRRSLKGPVLSRRLRR